MIGDELRFGRTWDPWREMNRLQEEVNRLFSSALETRTIGTPAVNVWTNEEGAVLRVILPGHESDKVDISVLGDSITLSGRRDPEVERRDVTYHRREREHGSFTRTLQLPFRIEADAVKAKLERGILELQLPRASTDRPRRISVKAD